MKKSANWCIKVAQPHPRAPAARAARGTATSPTAAHGGASINTSVSASATTNGTPRTATYRITPPGGTWDPADNGTYTLTLAQSCPPTPGQAVKEPFVIPVRLGLVDVKLGERGQANVAFDTESHWVAVRSGDMARVFDVREGQETSAMAATAHAWFPVRPLKRKGTWRPFLRT